MTRALGPRVGLPPEATTPLIMIALAWVPVGLVSLVWLAGHAASQLSGFGWTGPPLSIDWGLELVKQGPAASWPGVPLALIWGLSGGTVAVIITVVTVVWTSASARRPIPGQPLRSLATEAEMAPLGPTAMAERARKLRPATLGHIPPKRIPLEHAGLPLGLLRGTKVQLRASWEDVMVVFMAPRTGKTSDIAVPQLLAAPGAAVATSNKADLWALTSELRQKRTGSPIRVFDPQHIAHVEQAFWWNPLRGVTNVEAANRLAGHFVSQIKGETRFEFWSQAAQEVLAALLLAAGSTVDSDDQRSLDDVYTWLNQPLTPVPAGILEKHGHIASARGLEGKQSGATETRDGIYETARVAASCLRDPSIMQWVTPPRAFPMDEFHTAEFAATTETLYLLSKEDAGGAAPLVAAFADRVMHDATLLAERRGGRLDPPMVVILDEAANICRIEALPRLYSHLGSRGVSPVTILQSYPQGEGVWGSNGMQTLWSAATIKIVGAGMDDDRFLESISRLIGEYDVTTRSISQGRGQFGESLSLRRQRKMPVEDLRGMAKGTTILMASGMPAAMLAMQPWYLGPDKAEIAAANQRALAHLTESAATSAMTVH
ncbi:MAG: type IV secretory system conjugative DNA transfer family protein [Actinomycetota bacterium]